MTVVGFPENPLLVPISIEALVVETKNQTGSDLSVDFSRLYEGNILGADLTPPLFQNSKKCNYGPGVHLHWTLPAAYRHGGSALARARRKAKAHDALAQRLADQPDVAEQRRLIKRLDVLWKHLNALVRELSDQKANSTAVKLAEEQVTALTQLSQISPILTAAERQRLAKRLSGLGMKLADLVEQKSQDELRFPVIPNRWLVKRIYCDADTKEIKVRAWVVESDYRYSYNPDKGADFDDKPDRPITVPIFDAMPLFDYVGKSFDFPGWKEEPHPRVELTALGYGDPAFAAYYPACKSVLGFHDSLQDVATKTALTYMVVGWHADPAKDILQYFDMEELGWSCKAPADADFYPEHVLCHGSIYDMQWKQKTLAGAQENRYASKIPSLTAKNCQIAIGNTSAEGLAALLAKKLNKPRLENLLTAFNDDLLTKDADYREIEARLHQHRFGSAAGGGQFFIDMKQAETEQSLSATDATLPRELQEALTELNKLQQNCDARERELTEARWALYATWCKWVTKYTDAVYAEEPAEITSILEAEKSGVLTEMQTLNNDLERLAQQRDDIVNTVKQRFADLEFVKSAAPPFWHANDPVLFISAPGLSPSSESRRARRNPQEARLTCRMAGQEITGMSLDIPDGLKDIAVHADDVFTLDAASRGLLKLPDGIFKLLHETLLLDPAKAEAIAGKAYTAAGLSTRVKMEELVETIKVLQRPRHSEPGITEPPPTAAETPRLTGTIPELIALRDWDGNPWLPLFIQWEVAWKSSYTSLDKALEHWQLVNEDGKPRADGEFHWDETTPTPTEFPNTYSGYGILSPHATWSLEERLEKYNADKPEQVLEQVLDQVITQLGDMNVLGLSLGGLHNGFIMRDQIIRPRPINPRIFGQDPPLDPKDPISEFLTGSISRLSPGFDKPFFPLRAGHLKLTRLSIVDTFGQTLIVPMEQLIRASSVKSSVNTPGTKQLIQLSPRFAQPLRLRFDWEPAQNPAETLPVDSPVCGWVIPNHLDKNLLFYDASGTPLGVLQKILSLTAEGAKGGVPNTDAKAFFWVPMPGTAHQPESIINPELKYFVDFLQDMGADNGNNFWSLLDAALANTDPGEPEQDSLLAVLLGRPLALVRATVQLELDGLAATDQHLDKIGEPVAVDFTKIKFPLCLGDAANSRDGLVGFFLHDSKGEVVKPFYAAAGAEEQPGLPVENLIEYKHSHDILDCATPVALTLLMDPRAKVHLTTGILPKRSVELPSRVSSAAQSAKEAFFQVAPLISPGNVGSGGDVSMPKPSDDFGKWSWAYRPQVTMWQEAKEITASSDRGSFHPRQQEISEGWLKLKMNPVAILSFWVKEGMQEVAMNTNITLAWVLQGGDRLTLLANGDDKNPIRVWDTAPLPEQYSVQVQSEITYTLILFNKDNNRAEKRITIRIAKGINHGE